MLRSSLRFCAIWLFAAFASPVAFGQTLDLPYTLTRPAGEGPFPAVIILHDCSGLGGKSSGAPWRWASELTPRGYVTLWPDSFTQRDRPRGICTDTTLPRKITPELRARDAYAALRYLQSLPFVDPRRIAVMGGSHGGTSTLATILDTPGNKERGDAGFAAAIALYPACGRTIGGWNLKRQREPAGDGTGAFKPLAPLLILIGELDDWTPAKPCRELAEAAREAGYPVEIKVYPGAHHSFDSLAPVRFVAERANANAPGGLGATTGGNAEAWADAIERVTAFLADRIGKR